MDIGQRSITISSVDSQHEIRNLYPLLSELEEEYPRFEQWYFSKVVPEVMAGKRMVFVAYDDGHPAGILIVKDSEGEKKICTLRVIPMYQRRGIGRQLLNLAIQVLETYKPLITVSDSHQSEFVRLFEEYDFLFCEAHVDAYRKGHSEYVYNGQLK